MVTPITLIETVPRVRKFYRQNIVCVFLTVYKRMYYPRFSRRLKTSPLSDAFKFFFTIFHDNSRQQAWPTPGQSQGVGDAANYICLVIRYLCVVPIWVGRLPRALGVYTQFLLI